MPWKDSTEKQKHVCNIFINVYANKVKYCIKKYRHLIVLRFCFMSWSILLSLVSIAGSKNQSVQLPIFIFDLLFLCILIQFLLRDMKNIFDAFALRASYKDSEFCALNFSQIALALHCLVESHSCKNSVLSGLDIS